MFTEEGDGDSVVLKEGMSSLTDESVPHLDSYGDQEHGEVGVANLAR